MQHELDLFDLNHEILSKDNQIYLGIDKSKDQLSEDDGTAFQLRPSVIKKTVSPSAKNDQIY